MLTDTELYNFFANGFYRQFWKWELTEKDSRYIAEKSLQLLDADTGHILDWCGGWGRISYYYASKGFIVTLLDFIEEYLDMAEMIFKKGGYSLTKILSDFRETPSDIQADYGVSLFNSVGFVSDDEQLRGFKALYNALKPGAKILIDCVNQHYIIRNFKQTMIKHDKFGNSYIYKNSFDNRKNILISEYLMEDNCKNKIINNTFYQRVYSPCEIENLINKAGFKVLKMYGSYEGDNLSFELPAIILTAVKN